MPVNKLSLGHSVSFCLFALICVLTASSSAQSGRVPPQDDNPPVPKAQTPARPQQQKQPDSDQSKEQGTPDEVLTVNTDLTTVLFTAVDKDKRFLTNLKQSDFQIKENGSAQEITVFERETDLPLSIGILIDVSGSEERSLPDEKAAARVFVESVIRPAKDRVAVVSFTGDATVEQDLTSSVIALEKAISNVEIVTPVGPTAVVTASGVPIPIGADPSQGATAIWDAIWSTSNTMLSHTPEHTRRAIILLTDGEDTWSRTNRQDAIDQAVKDNVAIYAIGIGDRKHYGIDEGALKKISERTGGRAFFPNSEADLHVAFAQIQEELRSQYLIAYSSTNKARDGSFRKIELDVVNPDLKKEKLRLLYRDGYFAKTGDAPKLPVSKP